MSSISFELAMPRSSSGSVEVLSFFGGVRRSTAVPQVGSLVSTTTRWRGQGEWIKRGIAGRRLVCNYKKYVKVVDL